MKRTKQPKNQKVPEAAQRVGSILAIPALSELASRAKTGPKCRYEQNPDYYCDAVIRYMAEGMTKEAAFAYMGVGPWAIHAWQTKFSEFADAVKKGEKLREIWWMEQGRINIYNPKFNTPLYMRIMANLYGWRSDKIEVQGKLDHSHEHSATNQQLNLDKLSKQELQQLKTFVEKAIDNRGTSPVLTIH